jgi:hypothetical protein
MGLHYVLFDGSSAFVVGEQDMLDITASDKDVEVIFKSASIVQAFEFADRYNYAI